MKKTVRDKWFIVILLTFLPLLSSCGFKDIDKNAFVAAIGIDMSDDKEKPFKVTLKIFVPAVSFKQATEPKYAYVSMEARTIGDALRLLEAKIERRMELGHSKLIVLGEDVLDEDLSELTDFLMRRADIQLISWAVVGRPNAEEILNAIPVSESATYPSLYNFFDVNGSNSPYVIVTHLFELHRGFIEDGVNPIIPIVEFSKENSTYTIDKAFVLLDETEPLELSPDETKVFNVLTNSATRTDVIIEDREILAVALIDQYKSKLKLNMDERGKAKLSADLEMIGSLVESEQKIKSGELSRVNKVAKEDVERTVKDFLQRLADEGADPLGIGLKYRGSKLHNEIDFKEWEKAYKNMEIDVNVKFDLKSTGATY